MLLFLSLVKIWHLFIDITVLYWFFAMESVHYDLRYLEC